MVEQFATPPLNPVVSIRPLTTTSPGRDATATPTPLANLPPGTTLEGFVVNRDAQNNPILRTPMGDLQMKSDVFVKTGSAMVIRVDATSETRARIISIDGLPPQDYAARNARGLTQDTIMPAPLGQLRPEAALPQAAAPLQALPALLLAPGMPAMPNPLFLQMPGVNTPMPAPLMTLQVGAALKVAVLQVELPAAIPAAPATERPAPVAPPTQAPAGAAPAPSSPAVPPGMPPLPAAAAPIPAAPTPAAASPAMPASAAPVAAVQAAIMAAPETAKAVQSVPQEMLPLAIPAAHPMPARAMAAYPPHSAPMALPTAPPQAPVPQGIPALVIGREGGDTAIVQTPVGTLKLLLPATLPLHSRLTLDIQPAAAGPVQQAAPAIPGAPMPEEAEGLGVLSRGWPHLAEAMPWLGTPDAAMASREPMAFLPQVGPKLTSGLLFFLAAVKGGDVRQWMGPRLFDRLEAKMPELAARLKGEMGQLQQLLLHSPIDQWSVVMLPMLHGGQLDYARFYLRDDHAEGDDAQKQQGKEQRFIVEVELSHLGDMQFDGFIRQGGKGKQFDLIVRTERPLDAQVSGDIRALFGQSMGASGYVGYLGFQHGAQHFVRPLAGPPDARPNDGHTILA